MNNLKQINKQKLKQRIHAATNSACMNSHLLVSAIHLNAVIRRYIMTIMGLDYLKHQELIRSNLARESENYRTNVENENLKRGQNVETARHNVVGESQGWDDLRIKQGSLDESVRTHKANEHISWTTVQENVRANKAREGENIRSNLAREAELNRSNVARETENIRNNTLDALSSIGAATYAGYSDPQYQATVTAGDSAATGTLTGNAVGTFVDVLAKLNPFAKKLGKAS